MSDAEPVPADSTDEALLEAVRRGQGRAVGSARASHAAFAELVRRYQHELYGYLRRYLGHDDLAEDVFQNTFLAVFTKVRHYQPGRAAKPWLYAVATNQAIDALRRQRRRLEVRTGSAPTDASLDARPGLDQLPTAAPDPADAAENAEAHAQVRAAVDALPDLLRQVVVLAYFQGLKYQEIAEALSIPLGTVKSRLHAAMAKLTDTWPHTDEAKS